MNFKVKGGQSNIYDSVYNDKQIIIKQFLSNQNGYQEYCYLKQLQQCKHIVKIIKYQEIKDIQQIWLERAEFDLFDYMEQYGCFEQGKTLQQLIIQILNAVQSIHYRDIIHLDLKIENILINSDKTIQICDFGLAKNKDQKITQKTNIDISIMNPVLVQEWLDIKSLGLVFFQMRFGYLPFKIANSTDMNYMLFIQDIYKLLQNLQVKYTQQDQDFIDFVQQIITNTTNINSLFSHKYMLNALNEQIN